MADPYANLAEADPAMQRAIADAMQARARDPDQVALRHAYLGQITLSDGATAVEFGSGTGEVTSDLVTVCGAARAIGIEPGPVMVERALEAYAGRADLVFRVGDAAKTDLEDASVDLVVMHTLLCHAPQYEAIMAEAARVLRPGGQLALFDGDYDTATCAIGYFDPLDQVVQFMIDHNVTNRWVTRQFRSLMSRHGFDVSGVAVHAYIAGPEPTYFRTVIERALMIMEERQLLSPEGAAGLRAETEARIRDGRFFGYMSYVSAHGRKGGAP